MRMHFCQLLAHDNPFLLVTPDCIIPIQLKVTFSGDVSNIVAHFLFYLRTSLED